MLVENSTEQNAGTCDNAHRPSWNFDVSAGNKTISLTLLANHDEAYLSDLVPVTHQVCDTIIRLAADNETENGPEISCKKGCAQCCSYLVSLSSAEAFYLQKQILSLPGEKRKPILHSFLRAARKIAANKIPPVNTTGMDESQRLESISNWYQKLDIKCPFIVDNTCSQYNARPLVCREHMVTSPPRACRPFSGMFTSTVELPISTAETLMEISNNIESTTEEAILLPLAMVWCNSNAQRGEKKHPAALLAKQFIKAISQKTPAMA
ncbi:MAG: YkgJ family cysteine cluster protein [Phycisphaerae bacterium]|nr:YkgJ family cysteine cluster protein [Phycisphaerae bacterium]